MSPLARAAALALALGAGACSIAKDRFPGFRSAPPRTFAVLAPEGTFPERGREIFRRILGTCLAERQYQKLDDAIVDAALTRAGFLPGEERWIPADADLVSAGRTLGADALVLLTGFEDTSVSAAVLYQRGIAGHLRILDVRSGATLWSTDVSTSRLGGLAVESGQVIKALEHNSENGSELAFVRLASSIAHEIAAEIPEGTAPAELQARPTIDGLEVAFDGDRLVPGIEWIATVRGTPRGRAVIGFADLPHEFPLVEESPGLYRGRYRVLPGWGTTKGSFRAVLYDAFGDASRVQVLARVDVVEAPRLDPPGRPSAALADAAERRVTLTWEPARGVTSYQVVRMGRGAPVSFVIETGTEFEDRVPSSEERVTYLVSSRSRGGAVGPSSAPVSVEWKP